MQGPFVSILCPAYRASKYVGCMIESVQAQTYRNWELIIVDDGSDDDQCEVIERYASLDTRIGLHRSPHIGMPAAFGLAFTFARGDFIGKQDADDWSEPQRIERQMQTLLAEDAHVVTCLMALACMQPDGSVVKKHHKAGSGLDPYDLCTVNRLAGPSTGTIISRRVVWETVGPPDPTLASDDCDWLFRIVAEDPPFVWAHVSEELYNYRQHSEQHSAENRDLVWAEFWNAKKKYGPKILARLRRDGLTEKFAHTTVARREWKGGTS